MDQSPFNRRWMKDVQGQVEDPILASLICVLGGHVNSVVTTFQSKDWGGHFIAVLDTCRTSQHIRLHVGNMQNMELAAHPFVAEALQVATQNFGEPDRIAAANRDEFVQATTNIRDRLALLYEDPEPVLKSS